MSHEEIMDEDPNGLFTNENEGTFVTPQALLPKFTSIEFCACEYNAARRKTRPKKSLVKFIRIFSEFIMK